MSNQSWQQTLAFAPVAGSAVAGTTSPTPTSILPPAARAVVPAGFFNIGTLLRVKAAGIISTVTTPGTLTFTVTFGSIATAIAVFNSGALALNASATTNFTWLLEVLLTCRAVGVGANAQMIGTGTFVSRSLLNAPVVGTTQGVGVALLPDTAPAVGTGFDSVDVANVVDLMVTWGTSNANSITLQQYTLELLN